jgi:hypothetical protein
MRATVVALVIGLLSVGGAAGSAGDGVVGQPKPFSLNNAQAQEIATVVGFVRAYNAGDLDAALSYVKHRRDIPYGASDCDYRRHTSRIYWFRKGLIQWLRARFADHDHLTISRVYASSQVGFVVVEFTRRTSDSLRRLGYPNGIVPQIGVKMPLFFEGGVPTMPDFYLASPTHVGRNPECALMAASPPVKH